MKTAGSMRVVPVHPELVRLGFIKYRGGMEAAGHTRLFPEAKRNSRGQMIADLSREFGRYLVRIGIKQGRGLSLYSFAMALPMRFDGLDFWMSNSDSLLVTPGAP